MRQQIPAVATVAFDPSYGRSVRVAEFDRPMMGDDVETAQTIAYMEELASFDAGERSVIEATHRALEEAGLDMTATPIEKAKAIFWWLKRTIRYVPTPGTSVNVDQTLIAPSAMLAMQDPEGDCPQFSMLAAAMFRICCVTCLFKTIAAEPAFPNLFSHVYNVVEVAPGTFMPFDSSNGPAPGAEFAKPLKQRVWPRTVPDRCRQKKGNVLMIRSGSAPSGWRNGKLRGSLRDLDVYSDTDSIADQVAAINDLSDSVYGSGSGSPSTSRSGSSLWATIANDVTQLAAPLIRQATAPKPYYVTNAQGQQVLFNPSTGQIAGSGSLSMSPTAWLLIGIVGIGFLATRSR